MHRNTFLDNITDVEDKRMSMDEIDEFLSNEPVSPLYVSAFKDGYRDIYFGNKAIDRLDLSGKYSQDFALGYRMGVKQARKEHLTRSQRILMIMRARDVNKSFDAMGSFTLA